MKKQKKNARKKNVVAKSLLKEETPVNRDAINYARGATYTGNIVADVTPERLRQFFIKEEMGYRVKKDIREMVVFAVHDVTKDPPFTKLDLIYRIIQETMNNIVRHSQADSVRLSLKKREKQIELRIEDKGFGFELTKPADHSSRGFGLTSMREQTELSGGSFMIESKPGSGAVIKATWPL